MFSKQLILISIYAVVLVIALIGGVAFVLIPDPVEELSVGADIIIISPTMESELQLIASGTVTVREIIKTKNQKDKNNIKGYEIARRTPTGEYTDNQTGLRVEIVSIEHIEGGVQIFAKAWDGTQQLGFGRDGSVEIERFRIFNPPIMIDDPNGEIIKRYKNTLGKNTTRILKEDPEAAIKESLAHTILVSGKRNNNIEIGKVGNTTDTFFPDASSNDGGAGRRANTGGNDAADWASSQGNATAEAVDDTSAFLGIYIGVGIRYTTTHRYILDRIVFGFDTAAIPDGNTIDSATLSLFPQSAGEIENDVSTGNDDVFIVEATPASDTNLVVGDYDAIGDSVAAPTHRSNDIAFSALNGTAYNDFILNAGGLTFVDATGVSNFGMRTGDDITAEPSGFANGDGNRWVAESSEEAGTTKDPKLVVTHSEAAGAPVGEEYSNFFGI